MKKIGFILAAAAAIAAAYWTFVRPRPLTLGTHGDFPPFAFRGEGADGIVGFDVDLARAIAEKTGRRLKIVDLEFGELLPALERGAVDLAAAALTLDAGRSPAADFSAPYYRATPVALIRKGDPVPAAPDDLRGRQIGVQVGSTGAGLAAEWTAEENVRTATSPLGTVVDLMNSQVDVAILDEQAAVRFELEHPEVQLVRLGFAEEFYAIAVRRGNAELLETIDGVLAEMAADGRIDALVDRWMVRAMGEEAEGK